MTSRKCLFNFKLFKKCLFQQKYVMLIHTVLLILSTTVFACLGYTEENRYTHSYTTYEEIFDFLSLSTVFVVLFIIAVSFISTHTGFSHLYKRSSSVFFGAMPVKRGSMYITKLFACLTSVIIPVVFVAVINFIILNLMSFGAWDIAAETAGEFWLRVGYILIQYILFTAVFSFAATVSGNGFAQFITAGFVCLVCPVSFLIISGIIEVAFENMRIIQNPDFGYMFPAAYHLTYEFPELKFFIFSLAAAVCFMLFGGLLYIKRRNEKSDEFYAFKGVNVFIKYYVSLCIALLIYIIAKSAFSPDSDMRAVIMGTVFGILGFIIIQGIFEKSFRAMFSKPKQIVAYLLIAAVSFSLVEFDIFGFNNYFNNVKAVTVFWFDHNVDVIPGEFAVTLDSTECIEAVRAIAEKEEDYMQSISPETHWYSVDFRTDRDSDSVRRYYSVTYDEYQKFAEVIINSDDYKNEYIRFIEKNHDSSEWNLMAYGNQISIAPEFTDEFLKALSEDIKEQKYKKISESTIAYEIEIRRADRESQIVTVPVYGCYGKTISLIQEKYSSLMPDFSEGITLENYNGKSHVVTDSAEIEAIIGKTGSRSNYFRERYYSGICSVIDNKTGIRAGLVYIADLPDELVGKITD